MNTLVGVLLALLAIASTAGAGLELDLAQLSARAVWRPVGRALVANLFVIPAATLGLLQLLPLPADTHAALALVAFVPGGASAPLLARLAGGEPTRVGAVYVALSVSCLVSLALLLPMSTDVALPSVPLLALCIALQLVPLAIGLWLRARHAPRARVHAARLRQAGSALLGVVVALLLLTRGSFLLTLGATTLVGLLLVAAVSLAAGALLAPAPRLPDATLAAVRNLTLALMVAEGTDPGGMVTLLIAAYGLVMYVGVAVCVRFFRAPIPASEEPA